MNSRERWLDLRQGDDSQLQKVLGVLVLAKCGGAQMEAERERRGEREISRSQARIHSHFATVGKKETRSQKGANGKRPGA